MKVLHISNWKNLSGWSKQAQNHILALDAVGVDVVPRHVEILNNRDESIHPRILELEKKTCSHPDVIIQNVLPNFLQYTRHSRGVSYFVCETSSFKSTGWNNQLNLMDAIFVPCYATRLACEQSGVNKKISIVPEAIDVEKCAQHWPKHSMRSQLKDKFIFLCVAEWTVRKNIDAIIRAFHTEFSPSEPVELVIKTTPVGMKNPQQDINNRLDSIKRSMKLYKDLSKYKREHVICGLLSQDDMYSLIRSADCYVTASRAEAFNISLAEAMAMGKIVIAPNHSGMDYLTINNSYIVSYREEPCYNALDTLPDLYSSREAWWEPNILSLRECMRSAYEKKRLNLRKQQQARKDAQQFSFEAVGKKYKEELEKL